MPYGLDDATVARMQGVFAGFPEIDRVVLYGSRALGRQRAGSDIDITFFGAGLERSVLNRIEAALDDLDLPYIIDASLFEKITTDSLKDHIRRVGVVFYERPTESR